MQGWNHDISCDYWVVYQNIAIPAGILVLKRNRLTSLQTWFRNLGTLFVKGEKHNVYEIYSNVNNRRRIESRTTLQNELCLYRQKNYCEITYKLKNANVYFDFSMSVQ